MLLQATLALSLVVSSLKSACIRQQTVVSITVRRASTHVAFSWHFLTSSMLRSTMDSRAFVVSTARRRRCGRRVRLLTTGTASCVILSSLCSSEYRPWSVAVSYSRFSDCGTLSRRHNSCSCTAQHMVGLFCTRSSAIAEGPRDASCQIKSCQLPRNSAETTYTTSPDQIHGMKLEILSEAMRDRQCALNHDAIESASIVSLKCHKQTDDVELCISPVYRRLAVAKFSKSTM